jgi:hypothetical protein
MIGKANIIRVTKKVFLEPHNDIVIKPITEDNINDGRSFNSNEEIQAFRDFLNQGHKGYYGYYQGNCGIRIWIFNSKDRCLVGNGFYYDLPSDEAFLAWSETSKDFRKKGLYTEALKFAINDNKSKVISGYVESDNIGSLKGTENAGFETIEKYRLFSFSRLHVKIKVYEIGKGKCFNFSFGRRIKVLEK